MGRSQRLAGLRHVQDVGVQFGCHDESQGRRRMEWEEEGEERKRGDTGVKDGEGGREVCQLQRERGVVNKRGEEEEEEEEEMGGREGGGERVEFG